MKPGDTVTCAETGRPFVVQTDGFTFNYATGPDGKIYSDEGVHIWEVRGLLDRSKPFGCYISADGRRVTGWKGNTLGHIVSRSTVKLARRSWLHGSTIWAIRVRDVHGGFWHGRGSPGVFVNLRPYKG